MLGISPSTMSSTSPSQVLINDPSVPIRSFHCAKLDWSPPAMNSTTRKPPSPPPSRSRTYCSMQECGFLHAQNCFLYARQGINHGRLVRSKIQLQEQGDALHRKPKEALPCARYTR